MDTKNKKFYLQLERGRAFPVFLRFTDEAYYSSAHVELEKVGFKKVEEKVYTKLVKSKSKYNLLNIVEASAQVANIILAGASGAQQYGCESVSAHKNYQVYKYKSHGMMVFSPFTNVWELGTLCDLTIEEDINVFTIIINRYLSMVLVDYGVAAFWAVPIDEGMVVMSQKKSKNEIVFVDIKYMKLLTQEDVRPIKGDFQILRLDPLIKSETKLMKKEEVFSFLMTHSSYFSYFGPSHNLKGLIYKIISFGQGRIYPEESFLPRTTDLPLAS